MLADHKLSNGNAQTVTINVNFQTGGPPSTLIDSGSNNVWMVFVWDRNQGGNTDQPFGFSSAPRILSLNDQNNVGASVSLSPVTLQTKSGGTFAASTGSYLYSGTVSNPYGLWQITFATNNGASGANPQLNYNVAVMKMDQTKGHWASSASTPAYYTFGSSNNAQVYLPLISTTSGSTTAYTAITGGYGALDGRLVQDMTIAAVAGTGLSLSASIAGTGPTSSSNSGSTYTGFFEFPPGATGQDNSGSGGMLTTAWTITYLGSTTALDTTATPGPFLQVTPGSTNDRFTDAMTLSSGSTVSINFDGSASSGLATKSRQLVRMQIPTDWWAIRLSASAVATSGSGPTNKAAQLPGFAGTFQWSGYSSTPASGMDSGSFSNVPTDPHNQGSYYIFNSGLGLSSSNPFRPFTNIANPLYLSGSSQNGISESYYAPNYPMYDNRLTLGRYIYLRVCRRSGCSNSPYSGNDVMQTTVTVSWPSTMAIAGECSSNADCVSNRPSGHPSAARAAHFSANGDVNRFATCMLVPSGDNVDIPESRCMECLSNCDCMPGQFCNRLTGLRQVSATTGSTFLKYDELTRLRMGTCMKKDLNNTQIGKTCRDTAYTPMAQLISSTAAYPVTQSYNRVPIVQGQSGPVACGDAVYINNTMSNSQFNSSSLPYVWLWQGYCDANRVCRECAPSGALVSPSTQCSNQQICLDGTYFPVLSLDQTIRTFANDTRAGTLLAIVFMFLVLLFGMAIQCFMGYRSRGAKPTAETTNPLSAKAKPEA
jgi:hypothetical protein